MSIQIIEDPNAGGLGAQLGRSMGEGLREAIPKGMERGALAGGLRRMQGKNLSPMETLANLSSYGADVKELLPFLPLMQNSQANRDFMDGDVPSGVGKLQGEARQMSTQGESNEFTPLKGDPESLQERARQLMRRQPSRFLSIDSAMKQAQDNYVAQQELIRNTEAEFTKSLDARIQQNASEPFKKIIGEMQQDYIRKATNDVASGKLTEQQAADKYSKELLDFSKMRSKLSKDSFSIGKLFRGSSKEVLGGIREEYKKRDALELFAHDLEIQQGMSAQAANVIAYPISKELASKVSSGKGPVEFRSKEKTDKSLMKMAEAITPDQSILSLAHEIQKKGLARKDFMKRLFELNKENKIALTPLQQRQTVEALKGLSMQDIFNYSLWGLE